MLESQKFKPTVQSEDMEIYRFHNGNYNSELPNKKYITSEDYEAMLIAVKNVYIVDSLHPVDPFGWIEKEKRYKKIKER